MVDAASLLHLGQKPSPRERGRMLPSTPQKTRRHFLTYSLRFAIAVFTLFLGPLLSSRAIAAEMQESAKLAPQGAGPVDPQKAAAFEKEIADIRTALIQRYPKAVWGSSEQDRYVMVFTAIIAGQLEPPPRDLSRLAILCSLALDLLFPDPTGYLDVIMARLSNAKSHYDEAAHDKLVRAMREHAGALIKEALGDEAARQFNAGEPWENAPEKVSLLLKAFAKVIPEQQMPTPYFVYLFDMDNYDDKDHEFDGRGGLARQFVVRSLPEEARRNWATLSAIQQYRTLQIAFVQLFKDAADAAVSHEKYNEFATRQKLDEALGPNPRPDHEVLEAFGLEAMKRYRKNPDPALLRSAILLHFGLTQVVFFFSVPDPRGTPGPPAVGPPQ